MQQRRLGATGLMISELCLGCMTFGEDIYPYWFIREAQRV